ncbi:hypothetical protein U3653_23110 [Nocardia sp. CDC186]|uniref:Uncharacterized protein n=1 Tax=Nocardia implantans TaxID=3108168 RepID=A0ABU6AZQ0_9NOCA|nr:MULTISPECIES: hypothetical protein [unclassified Nocardia]MBF6191357.1 hypothetical protein [Nocardia beijingensis]MEA3532998.1 hypothetical protein [Nocardia sp. CDC192]MEB3512930.1 hypothetical protein [Nocardia sp. CDC186]
MPQRENFPEPGQIMNEIASLAAATPAGITLWLLLRDPIRSSGVVAVLVAVLSKDKERRKAALQVVECLNGQSRGGQRSLARRLTRGRTPPPPPQLAGSDEPNQ